ncbi:MAG: radical SAM protein [Clostridia bacterium]|nr:radical SAM protein [Clostridia bacterium]
MMYKKAYIEITNICNMNCSFCHGHKRAPKRMSREEFALVLERLKGYTEYIYYHLMGEPLTHPYLPEFLKMARESGYKSIITTNGTLLWKRGEELLENLHKVNLSLHSFEDGNEEAYKRYVRSLTDYAKKASDKGIIVVFRLWNKGYDGGRNEMALNLLKREIEGEWAENTRGIRLRDGIYLEYGDRFEWPDITACDNGDRVFCYGLRDQIGILADGTVVPCCLDSEGNIALGNIFDTELDKIVTSERAVAIAEGFRNRYASEELCRKCGYARLHFTR